MRIKKPGFYKYGICTLYIDKFNGEMEKARPTSEVIHYESN